MWRGLRHGPGVRNCGLLVRPTLTDVFDDLTALRQEQRAPGSRRRPRLDRNVCPYSARQGAGALSPDWRASVGAAVRAGPADPEGRGATRSSSPCADECGGSQAAILGGGFAATGGGRCGSGRMARERSEPVGDASLVPAAGLAPQHGANPPPTWAVYGASDAPNPPPVTFCFSVSILSLAF